MRPARATVGSLCKWTVDDEEPDPAHPAHRVTSLAPTGNEPAAAGTRARNLSQKELPNLSRLDNAALSWSSRGYARAMSSLIANTRTLLGSQELVTVVPHETA